MDGDGEMYSIRYLLTSDLRDAVERGRALHERSTRGGVEPDTRHSDEHRAPRNGGAWMWRTAATRRSERSKSESAPDARDREWDDSDANLFRAYLTWRHQF